MENIPNVPDYPEKAIEVGRNLCIEVLEPIQRQFGRLAIRSAYRAPAVNAKGAENGNQYNCSSNEANYAGHIWDYESADGTRGATACIVVPSILPYFNETGDWQALAWWIHDNVPGYSSMFFFPKNVAFNINWSTNPLKRIDSYVAPKGCLTKAGEKNQQGDHKAAYRRLLESIAS